MADNNPINPLDPLGPEFGGINRPVLDTKGYSPFEGKNLSDPVVKFPNYFSIYPNTKDFDRPDSVIRSSVKAPPNVEKGYITPEAFRQKVKVLAAESTDRNQYAKAYAYDASPSGNAFYKRYAAYGNETLDKIGFHPFRDNEAVFNSQTSLGQDFSRMMTHSFWPLFSRGFVSGPKSLAKMLQGDFSSSDLEDAEIYAEAAAIGQSSKKGIGAFVNNTAMNFAYTAGIISEAVLEEVAGFLLAAPTGGASLFATTANAGKNIFRGVKGLDAAVDGMKAVNNTLNGLNDINKARSFWQNAAKLPGAFLDTKLGKFVNPLENTRDAYKALKNVDNIEGLARLTHASYKTAGGFYRDVRNINMALAEARLEAGFVENEVYDKLYNNFYHKTGVAPSDDEQKSMMQQSKEASYETLKWNAALIFGSNKIVFPNIMGPKMGKTFLKSKIDDIVDLKEGKIIFKEAKKEAGKNITKGEFKYVKKLSLENLKSAPLKKTLTLGAGYLKANITEGLQENAQEIIANAHQNYYIDTFYDKAASTHLYNKALSDYALEEFGNQFTTQGLETFMSGFLMGTFAAPLNAALPAMNIGYNRIFNAAEYNKYKEQRQTYGENLSKKLQTLYDNPKEFFDSRLFNYASQNGIADVRQEGSTKEIHDAMEEALVNQVYTALDTNTLNYFTDHISSMKNATQEEFEEALGLEKGTGAKYQSQIDNILGKAKEIEKTYKEANERFPEPVDLSKLQEGTPEYIKGALLNQAWNESKKSYIFMNQAFKDTGARMTSIMETILKEPTLNDMSLTDVQVIFDEGRLNNEIGLLKNEITNLETLTDPASKKDLQFKKDKVAALEAFQTVFEKREKYKNKDKYVAQARAVLAKMTEVDSESVSDEDLQNFLDEELGVTSEENDIAFDSLLETAFKDYMKVLGKNTNSHIFTADMDSAFDKLKDYYALGREARILADHINTLHNPKGFLDLVDKNNTWMSEMYYNRKDYFDNVVKSVLEAKEGNDLLNALANVNIFVSLDDFEKFLKTGEVPAEFFDNTNKQVITRNNPKYQKLVDVFMMLADLKSSESTPTYSEELQAELDKLDKQMQDEIDALDKVEDRVNKETFEATKKKDLLIKDVIDKLDVGQYAELEFQDGNTIIYYKSEEGLRYDNESGELVDVKKDKSRYKKGVVFSFEMVPDPIKVAQIEEKYAKLREEVVNRYNKKQADANASKGFEAVTIDTDIETIRDQHPELYQELHTLFQKELDTMPIDTMEEEEVFELFRDFVKYNSEARIAVDEYNRKKAVEASLLTIPKENEFTLTFEDGKKFETKDFTTISDLRKVITILNDKIKANDAIIKTSKKKNEISKKEEWNNYYKAAIAKLERLIVSRNGEKLGEKVKDVIRSLQPIFSAQKLIEKVEGVGYKVNGKLLPNRVTGIAEKIAGGQYAYAHTDKIRSAYWLAVEKIIKDKGLNVDNANYKPSVEFLSQLITSLKDITQPLNKQGGFNSKLYEKLLEDSSNWLNENPEATAENLLEFIVEFATVNAYDTSSTAGTEIDILIRDYLSNKPISFDENIMSREAYDNLFSEEIDPQTKKPYGFIAALRQRVDAGELYIISQGLKVYDEELGIAGEIDLLVTDGTSIFLVDMKTGDQQKWENFNKDNKQYGKKTQYTAQQLLYSNLIYRMSGVDITKIALLPIEVNINPETGVILTANKPKGQSNITLELKPSEELIEKVNTIVPKTYTQEISPGIRVGVQHSTNAIAKLKALGFTQDMIDVMSDADFAKALTFTSKEDAAKLLIKYQVESTDSVKGTGKMNYKNLRSLEKRIDLLNKRRRLVEESSEELKSALNILEEAKNSNIEMSEAVVEGLLAQIENLQSLVKSSSKAKTKKGKSTLARIEELKANIREEFKATNNIVNSIRNLQYEYNLSQDLIKDLKDQVSYYYSLLEDPAMSTFSESEINDKIEKIQKKISALERLIEILKKAIKNTLAYLNEYLKLWQVADANYTKFQESTGYKPLSQEELSDLIKSTDPESVEFLNNYPKLSKQFNTLQNAVLENMDNVELMEEVKSNEETRLNNLLNKLRKYDNQVRYLEELLVEEIDEETGAKVEPFTDTDLSAPIVLQTISLSDIEDQTMDLEKEVNGLTQAPNVGEDVKISVDQIKKDLESITSAPELQLYKDSLNASVLRNQIDTEDIKIIQELLSQKAQEVGTVTDIQVGKINIKRGDKVYAKNDIFVTRGTTFMKFANEGDTLEVININPSNRQVALAIGNKIETFTFDEMKDFETMKDINQSISAAEEVLIEPLTSEEKDIISQSQDTISSYLKDSAQLAQDKADADEASIDDLKDDLFNDLIC